MSATTYDVRVGDVDTEFVGEIQDRGAAFNPAGATVAQLIFLTPNGTKFTRDATITTTGSGASQKWFLNYTTVQADIDAGLHAARGTHKWQGYFEWAGGAKFHTSIGSYLVEANL